MVMGDSKTLCSAFWKHTNIRNDNRVFPCCRFKTSIQTFDGDVDSILKSKNYDNLRSLSLNGKEIDGCAKCYYEESQGKTSLRQKFNNEYNTDKVELKFLEVGLDNICNLTCDGCWSEFSSSWSEKQYPDQPKSFHIRSSKDLQNIPATINKILFLGGEPLMTKRHYKILKKIKNRSNVSVIYNTNGTFRLDSDTVKMLKNFKKIKFIVSVDGYKQLNEKVRSGTKWSDIVTFIQSAQNFKFDVEINTVVHLNNWYGLQDLSTFIEQYKLSWTTNVLTYPKHLDIRNGKNKIKCKEFIDSVSNLPNKEYMLKHLE